MHPGERHGHGKVYGRGHAVSHGACICVLGGALSFGVLLRRLDITPTC